MSIHAAMAAIMAELEPIEKSHTLSSPGANYKYRSIDDFYSALQPLFKKHKVCLMPEVMELTTSVMTDSKERLKFRATVKVKYTFSVIHTGAGGSLYAISAGDGIDSGDKAVNKAITAAFKNCMQQVFIIPTGAPDDSEREDHDITVADKGQPIRVEQKVVDKHWENFL